MRVQCIRSLCNLAAMRLIALLILVLFLPLRSQAHPLHLSITNITYENGKLNISLKTFRDDWEVGYFHYHGQPVDFTDPAQRELPWFNSYLAERLRISQTSEGPHLALVVDSVSLA